MSTVKSPDDDFSIQAGNFDLDATRRAFVGALGLGVAGAAIVNGLGEEAMAQSITDAELFNFALNFEYLGAEFYAYATTGAGIAESLTTGTGTRGPVIGGAKANLSDPNVIAYAHQLASDELGHVKAVRSALPSPIARPTISLRPAFAAAAKAAGIPGTFDVFANDVNFLLGAFVLEDVCVTALKGAAPLIKSLANLDAAGLLGAEAYQAGMIRVKLYALAITTTPAIFRDTALISNLRDRLDADGDSDQPIELGGQANIVPTDADSIVFSRTPRQVLDIAYGRTGASQGQFFPAGVNGSIA